jgi:hypothetical protein
MFKLVTVGIALGACAAASAIWVDIPLEQVIRKADIVVVGKIGKVAAGEGPVKNGRRHDLGTIEVREVVKGDAAMKTVKLAWPSAGGLMTDVDLIYRAGQDGVWILKKDAKADAYWATYPKDFQPVGELKKIKEIVKAQAVTKEEKK